MGEILISCLNHPLTLIFLAVVIALIILLVSAVRKPRKGKWGVLFTAEGLCAVAAVALYFQFGNNRGFLGFGGFTESLIAIGTFAVLVVLLILSWIFWRAEQK